MKLLRRENNKQIYQVHSLVPYYVTAGFAAVWALLLPLYSTGWLIAYAVCCAGLFLLLRSVCGRLEAEQELPPEEVAEVDTADMLISKADRLADAVSNYDRLLHDLTEAILDEASEIFDYAEKHPESDDTVRHLLRYYLPTLVKLLEARISMNELDLSSPEGEATIERIHGAAATMRSAFTRAKGELFEAKAIDTEAEIKVMEQLLERDGLL